MKKIFLIYIFAFYNQSLFTMADLGKKNEASEGIKHHTVTEPYFPSFYTKHKKITDTSMAGVVGFVAAEASFVVTQEPDPLTVRDIGLIGIAGFTGYYLAKKALFWFVGKPTMLDLILTDPQAILDLNSKVCDDCMKAVQNQLSKKGIDLEAKELTDKQIDMFVGSFETHCTDHEKEAPLFFIGECQAQEFCSCMFTRSINPQYRERYEDTVVADLVEVSSSGSKPVSYASFGSGGMFTDLRIITKFLAKHPDANFSIHLIDGQYMPYPTAHEFATNDRRVFLSESQLLSRESCRHVIDLAKKAKQVKSGEEQKAKSDVYQSYAYNARKAYQFLNWITKTFPKAGIALCMHNLEDDFKKYVDSKKIPIDLLTACDIEDEMSVLRKGPVSYLALTKHYPDAKNIWLSKSDKTLEWDGQAHLLSISTREKFGYQTVVYTDQNDAEQTLYLKDVPL